MPLNYQVQKKAFGFDDSKTQKYVVSAKRGHTVSYEDVLSEVSKQSHLNPGQVYTAIEALIDVSITFMQQGHGVKLGDFGILKPSFSAASSVNSEGANASSIRRKKILFRPGKRLAKFIQDLSVTSIDSWDEETEEPGAEPGTDPTPKPEPGGGGGPGGDEGELT